MIEIPGFTVLDKIEEDTIFSYFRARCLSDQETVLITIVNQEKDIHLLESAYEITRPLDPEFILKPAALKFHNGIAFSVCEDFGAVPLSCLDTAYLTVTEVIRLFILIVRSLNHIHDSKIIHNDIKPDNVWFNPVSKQIKINGFGLGINYGNDTDPSAKIDVDCHDAVYMSPEQTGRTRLRITRSTDFYSLGCVMYEISSGNPPFIVQDTLELISCHLAKKPKEPHLINDKIPQSISGIIMKLLEKNPSRRYQSCLGLQTDLETCLGMIEGRQPIQNFMPGQHDIVSTLDFSGKLYGRDREIKTLIRTLTGEHGEPYPLILVSGAAGSGKSVLVDHVWKQSNLNAYFATGKHNRISTGGSAVESVFESLILQILGEGRTRVKEWKEKILNALGDTAQLVIEFIPMLEFIIGKQSSPIRLTAIETDIRLNIVIRKFIESIASTDRPLILFLDDMQWVEPESIRILETIELQPIPGFCIVCAYRDNETDLQHPFVQTLLNFKKNKSPVIEIKLAALDKDTQNQWISDILKRSLSETRSFSDRLYEKTDGNPFLLKSFLEYLSHSGLIYQSIEDHTFVWDLDQIDSTPLTDDVGYFMINKINQLGMESIELLKLASCQGYLYSLKTLEVVSGKKDKLFKDTLSPLIDKGILIQKRENLRFVHDIVQESVYSMMSEAERAEKHLKTGRQLLSNATEKEFYDQIFNIVDQMNFGMSMISNPLERVDLAELNLKAGQRKIESSSLKSADKYFQTGIELLPDFAWGTYFKLTKSLFLKRCELLYVLGEYSQAEQTFAQVLDHVELPPEDLLRIFEAKSTYLMQSYRAEEVFGSGLVILSKLGYPVSSRSGWFQQMKEVLIFKKQLMGKKINEILMLPEVTDSRHAAIIRVLIIITRAGALNGNPFAYIALFKSMQLVIKHGITPYAAYVFSLYGAVLSNLRYDLEKGYAFGKLALDIVKKFKADRQEILTHHLLIVTSINSFGQTKKYLKQLAMIVDNSLKSGLFMNIFNLHVMYFFLEFISGTPLAIIEKKMLASRKHILEANQIVWIHNLELLFQVVRTLMGKSRQTFLLENSTDIYNEKLIEGWAKTNTVSTISDYFLYRQILSYFFQNSQESLEYARKGAVYFTSYVSLSSQMAHRFFYALALIDRCRMADKKSRSGYQKMIDKNLKFLKMIYRKAPENNPHMYFLLEAETARRKKRFEKAVFYYEKAIASASESEYLYIEAICCELAGHYYLENKRIYFARLLILKSIECYRIWGLSSKVKQIETEYAGLIDKPYQTPVTHNETVDFKDIDIYSILKASQAISREIKPKSLMRSLIALILKNSGAQRAFLLLTTGSQLQIEAFGQTDPDSVKILQATPVEEVDKRLAGSVVYYTFLSKKSLILDDASLDIRFNHDPYIKEKKPVSILCMPVIGKKNIQGVLYLENNLMAGVFTKERLNVLGILIAQVVISMENSRLYEKLRTEIKKQVHSARKIQSHREQLRKMSSQLAQAEERERKEIADDLHDSVTQTLAMSISILKSLQASNGKDNFLRMKDTQSLLEQSLANIRSLTFQLSSPILYDVGLEAALEWLCEDYSQKHGLEIRFINGTNPATPLDNAVKITLYRAVRELIINIVKHAQTSSAVLVISCQDNFYCISMEDNGIGFNTFGVNKSDRFGLFSISERMRALNGNIHIHSIPGKGTKITIKVPLPTPSDKF